MTDNEIIERLQFLLKIGDAPIGKGFGVVIDKQDIHETLGLIKRQQEKIDKLYQTNFNLIKGIGDLVELTRAEAIKEFADRLKSKTMKMMQYDEGGWGCEIYVIGENDIDNLVKEMVGADNGEG